MNKNKIGRIVLSFIFLIILNQSGRAQVFDTSYARVLQNAVNALKVNYNLVGISAAVYVPGQGTWKGAAGISEAGVDMTTDRVFGIGSITKNFTATIILQLAEADSLTLDDHLYQWLPHYDNVDSNITIRQLLNHTSGIYNYTDNPAFLTAVNSNYNRHWLPEEVMPYVLTPNFPPGASWRYSNTNYLLLGMIITKIMRTSLSEQYHTRFFTPLGMTETTLESQDTNRSPYAHNWVDINGDGIPDDIFFIPRTAHFSAANAAGEIISRPENLLKWSRNLYKGALISPNSLNQMLTFVNASVSGANGYGLGTMRYNVNGKTCYGHGGNILGYSAAIMYYPVDSICIALDFNTSINTGAPAISFMNTVLNNRPSAVQNISSEVPEKFNLHQNYPNPFNPETNIKFDITSQGEVKLVVYNSLGKEVQNLFTGKLAPGSYSYKWNASGFPSGVYFYKLVTGNSSFIKKMMLVK
ncbi:MAG: serine hydrolase [Bacteroidetes bacterium]|nr:serine hydrolase [Bacteroidota bacterium]